MQYLHVLLRPSARINSILGKIALKIQEPIYIKQFKIPDAHRKEVKRHVLEWLKLGVIQPDRSRYSNPIFALMKKDGNVPLIQDFRALNQQSYTNKYSMKDVSECISEIDQSGSTNFTTSNLTASFWQMILHPRGQTLHCFHHSRHGPISVGNQPNGFAGVPS